MLNATSLLHLWLQGRPKLDLKHLNWKPFTVLLMSLETQNLNLVVFLPTFRMFDSLDNPLEASLAFLSLFLTCVPNQ